MAESTISVLPSPLPPPRTVPLMLPISGERPAAARPELLPDHAAALWRSCLSRGLRAALACAIVGATSAYAPAALRRHIPFPAFSYVTTLLVVAADATLGGALRGAACALYATAIGAAPSVLALWLARRAGESVAATAAVVALSAFAVALPESAGPVTKRIALGQIVIVYVANFRQGYHPSHAQAILRPAHVVACTVLGVLAAILAAVLPCPRLASHEVREKSKIYTEMAIERLRLCVEAFCAGNTSRMAASISQAKCFTSASTKLLHTLRSKQGGLQWERPPLEFLQPLLRATMPPLDKLQGIEMPLQAMEMALTTATKPLLPAFTCSASDHAEQLLAARTSLLHLRDQISLSLLRHHHRGAIDKNRTWPWHGPVGAMPESYKGLAPLFFLFSMLLLVQHGSRASPTSAVAADGQEKKVKVTPTAGEEPAETGPTTRRYRCVCFSSLAVVDALRCALSLGLAVLLGLLFSPEDGYWAGLVVATTMAAGRGESTFGLANARAQGAALGSVYGVLGCLIPEGLMELRLLALVPWIAFAAFLSRSRMYGQAGGVAAIVSAVIIVGRSHYGPPMAFTIARLTETFIGLTCSVLSELLFQPTRASTMARTQLSRTLGALRSCVAAIAAPHQCSAALKEQEKLQEHVDALKKYAAEAGAEPDLWFLPFPMASYSKLHGSLSRVAQLVCFQARAMELCHRMGAPWEAVQDRTRADMEQFKKLAASSLHCLEEVTHVRSLPRLEEEFLDLEAGDEHGDRFGGGGEEGGEVVRSFLGHVGEAMERADGDMKGEAMACMASIGFCMGGVMEEVRKLEAEVVELLQWENPGRRIDLNEIWCKMREVSKR